MDAKIGFIHSTQSEDAAIGVVKSSKAAVIYEVKGMDSLSAMK